MLIGRAFEKEGHRDLQDLGNLLQATGTNPVGPLLIFLDLLECDAQGFAELFLSHSKHQPAHANAAPDVLVDRI
jgi:hypothetical protein